MTPNRSADEPDIKIDDELRTDDSGEMASLLSDAYEAPAVPKSLVTRIDDGITERWGSSPELVPQRLENASQLARKGISWIRSWPVVAGLAASLALAVFLAGGSSNDAWAAMVDAMRRQQLMQIEDADGKRWLDLVNGVAGCQTSERTQWIDLSKRTVLSRSTASSTLLRAPISVNFSTTEDSALVAAFLVGQPLTGDSLGRYRGVQVVSQQLNDSPERESTELRVRLRTAAGEEFSLTMDLDRDTHLPRTVQANDQRTASAAPASLTYLNRSVAEMQADHFPSKLAVVDATLDASGELVALDRTDEPNALDPSPLSPSTDPPHVASLDPTLESDSSASNADSEKIRQAFVSALPTGAANKWSPVVVVPRSEEETLQRINELLKELWQREQVQPVDQASDLQMLRRAYLDLAGRTPTVNEVRNYLKDDRSDRYERLIDQLLASPDHASNLAAVWRAFLIPDGIDLETFGGREAFEQWLTERFSDDEPYDQIVRKLLLAEGRLSQSGPLLFYSALKLDAHELAAKTSRAFLGMRLECAQCHDHPFEPWTQEDFWSYAAFFAQISRPRGELENVSTVMRVHDVDRGEVMLPETDMVVPPRFLGQHSEDEADDGASTSARRNRLANWLTGADNPYFARATVNRLWSHLFGRGIVDPVDDFGMNNEPVSPELLDTLASELIDSNFDLQKVIRLIALSDAYRLSSSSQQPGEEESVSTKRLENFAQMNVKTLTPEQMYDCIAVATLLDNTSQNQYAVARFGNQNREAFLQQFAAPASNRSEYLAGIPQALMLMNGSLISGATGEQSSGLIRSLQAPFFTDQQRVDVVFMATLSRPATPDEVELFGEFVPDGGSQDQVSAGLADLLWALINSAEFTLNH